MTFLFKLKTKLKKKRTVDDIELENAATLHFDTLFKVKNPEFDPALEFILHHCRRKLWPPYNLEKQNEQGVMIEICSQILAPLCTEVTLESRYKTPFLWKTDACFHNLF